MPPVEESREDFEPVKTRKRKSKETQMESVTDGRPKRSEEWCAIIIQMFYCACLFDRHERISNINHEPNKVGPFDDEWKEWEPAF